QRHRDRVVIAHGGDEIDQAFLAERLDGCREGRVRHCLVTIHFGRVIVEDRLVLLHLGGTPAGGDVGADARVEPILHGCPIVAAPDPLTRPLSWRDHDRKLGQPRRLAGAPANVVRHCFELRSEGGTAHIDLEGRVPQRTGVVAWRLLQALDIGLLLGAELVWIERRIALLREGGERECASYGNKHGLDETLHGVLPWSLSCWLLGREGPRRKCSLELLLDTIGPCQSAACDPIY